MELYKRRDGRSPFWFCDFTDPQTGKRQRVSLKTVNKTEAMAKAVALVAEGGRKHVTLGTALVQYCKSLEGRPYHAESCRLARKATGGLDGRFGLSPDLDLGHLDTALATRLSDARRSEGNGPQTIAHELKLLRAAVLYASKRGAVVNREIDWPMPKLPMKTRYLSVEEFQRVYDWLAPDREFSVTRGDTVMAYSFGADTIVARQRQDAQDLFVALTLCGGRWSEVASLRWDRVDLEARSIRLWGSKTGKERMVPMPSLMHTMLVRRLGARLGASELVFPALGRGLRRRASQAIRRALQGCGLNSPELVNEMGRATVHSLRHTFASLLLQRGASLADIQHALGHKNLTMTMRYAHLLQGESVTRLAGIMNTAIGVQPRG